MTTRCLSFATTKLVEIQPASVLTTVSVLLRNSSMSLSWFSGSTVRILTRVTTSALTVIVAFMIAPPFEAADRRSVVKTARDMQTDRGWRKISTVAQKTTAPSAIPAPSIAGDIEAGTKGGNRSSGLERIRSRPNKESRHTCYFNVRGRRQYNGHGQHQTKVEKWNRRDRWTGTKRETRSLTKDISE